MESLRKLKEDEAGSMSVQETVYAIIVLVVGAAVITLLTVFTSVLSGQTYQLSQTQLATITNATILGYINTSIGGAFQAQSQIAGYLPLIVLAVIITIVIALVVGGIAGEFMGPRGGGYGGYGGYGGGGGGIL